MGARPHGRRGQQARHLNYWRADGTLCNRCPFVDGEPHGEFERYHQSGEVSQTGRFVEGQLHGPRVWIASDSPTTERMHGEGVNESVRKTEMLYDMGRVTKVSHFDGEGRPVSPDGSVIPDRPEGVAPGAYWQSEEAQWREGIANGDGNLEGLWSRWDPAGVLLQRETYAQGTLDGEAWVKTTPTQLGAPGVAAVTGQYVNGTRVGEWVVLGTSGEHLSTLDYGEAVGSDETLAFLDDEIRPAAVWHDLAATFEQRRLFGLALAAEARAAAAAGSGAELLAMLARLAIPLREEAAIEAFDEIDSLSGLLDGLVAGADPSAIFRQLAIQLDQNESSRAALDFINAALLLTPDRTADYFTRALIHMSLGEASAAAQDGGRVPDEGQREFVLNYVRVLFPVFDFWPAKETPHTHYDNLPEAPVKSLEQIRELIQKYATRLMAARAQIGDALGDNVPAPRWALPDLSALLPSGPVELQTYRFEVPDPDDPEDPYVIDVEEEQDTQGWAIPSLQRLVRSDWHALCWLCWSCGLDRVGLPSEVRPPTNFGIAAGMASARYWRVRDKIHMGGQGARMQEIPGFEWEGIDIDALHPGLAGMAESQYGDMQALMSWLARDDVRSPWQDDLRGS